MDREKQIEEIYEEIKYGTGSYSDDARSVAEILYDIGYRKQSEWISVDERLPEEAGKEYLVWDNIQATVKKRYFHRIPITIAVETYHYIREYFGNVSDYKRYTHWMPLPEHPKMKGGEDEQRDKNNLR